MTMFAQVTRDDSDSVDLCSEREIVKGVTAHASGLLYVVEANGSAFVDVTSPADRIRALVVREVASTEHAPSSGPSLPGVAVVVDESQYRCEQEAEDELLVADGFLSRLIAAAKEQPPAADWEQELDEL
jgi:hypothetical protein